MAGPDFHSAPLGAGSCRAGFCAAFNRLREVRVKRLQVVPERDLRRVADPRGKNVDRVVLHRVRLATRPHAVELLRPHGQPGAVNDLLEGGSEVRVHPPVRAAAGAPVA